MKTAKRILTLALAVMMVMAVMVVSASAASVSWPACFKKFATTTSTSYQTGYTKAIQSILMGYNTNTKNLIANSGGVDGVFGTNTMLAVQDFQDNETSIDSENDNYGKVNDVTWGKMAEVMSKTTTGATTLFKMNARKAITAVLSSNVYYFYYHNTAGTKDSTFASVYA